MKPLFFFGIAAMLFSGAAGAYELPSFSSAGYCLEVSEINGGSEKVLDGCIELEKDALTHLKEHWAALSKETREHCVAVAMVNGESYSALQDCVDEAAKGEDSRQA